jgi:hypothetical protein
VECKKVKLMKGEARIVVARVLVVEGREEMERSE